jgi:DNA-binding MarR family transcriptional regulator
VVPKTDDQPAELRLAVQGFVRRFGLLRDDRTPCGEPLTVSHGHALMILLERGEGAPVVQRDLARALGLDKSSVARLCSRMERARHIEQRRSELDGRAREITLTEKGERVARRVDAESRARFSRVLDAIPTKQRAVVVEAVKLLESAVRTIEASS